MLDSFDHRLLYGNEGELALVDYLKKNTNLNVFHRSVATISTVAEFFEVQNDMQLMDALHDYHENRLEAHLYQSLDQRRRKYYDDITKSFSNLVMANLTHGDIAIEWEVSPPQVYNGEEIEEYVSQFTGIPERNRFLKIDVKRGSFISLRSIKKYRGHFYALIPGGKVENISQTRIIRRGTVLRLYEDCQRGGCYHRPGKPYGLTTGPSGDEGIRITGTLRKEESIDEFNIRLIKAKIAGEDFRSPRLWKQYLTFGKIDLEEIERTVWE